MYTGRQFKMYSLLNTAPNLQPIYIIFEEYRSNITCRSNNSYVVPKWLENEISLNWQIWMSSLTDIIHGEKKNMHNARMGSASCKKIEKTMFVHVIVTVLLNMVTTFPNIKSPQKVWNILKTITGIFLELFGNEVYRIAYHYKACSFSFYFTMLTHL